MSTADVRAQHAVAQVALHRTVKQLDAGVAAVVLTADEARAIANTWMRLARQRDEARAFCAEQHDFIASVLLEDDPPPPPPAAPAAVVVVVLMEAA